MSAILAPSLLSADFSQSGAVCESLEKAGVKWLHLDVMDGCFVPNITFGPCLIEALRKRSRLFFDVHLMIEKPERYIADFVKAGSDLLVIHLETTSHPQLALQKIRDMGVYAGVALNPGTGFDNLRWLLPYIDLVLVMGVNPGFSGQKFIPETKNKLQELRKYLDRLGYVNMPVEMDGGASADNAEQLVACGADVLVSGSAFFKERNMATAVELFESAFAKASMNVNRESLGSVSGWQPLRKEE